MLAVLPASEQRVFLEGRLGGLGGMHSMSVTVDPWNSSQKPVVVFSIYALGHFPLGTIVTLGASGCGIWLWTPTSALPLHGCRYARKSLARCSMFGLGLTSITSLAGRICAEHSLSTQGRGLFGVLIAQQDVS